MGLKLLYSLNWLCVNDSDYRRLVTEGDLSGRPTECRYGLYPETKGGCHGNHFLALGGGITSVV